MLLKTLNLRQKALLICSFPIFVLIYDFIRIHIFRFPLEFFVRSSLYYVLLTLLLALIFLVTRLILMKKIDFLMTWPILFIVFLRLSIHKALPLFTNLIFPTFIALIISVIIICLERKNKLKFCQYFVYIFFCYTLFLIFIHGNLLIFLLVLCLPTLILFYKNTSGYLSSSAIIVIALSSLFVVTFITYIILLSFWLNFY